MRPWNGTWTRAAMLGAIAAWASAAGCEQGNPNAPNIEAPVVTPDAPQTSEEAAAQSEPPPITHKRGRRVDDRPRPSPSP